MPRFTRRRPFDNPLRWHRRMNQRRKPDRTFRITTRRWVDGGRQGGYGDRG